MVGCGVVCLEFSSGFFFRTFLLKKVPLTALKYLQQSNQQKHPQTVLAVPVKACGFAIFCHLPILRCFLLSSVSSTAMISEMGIKQFSV